MIFTVLVWIMSYFVVGMLISLGCYAVLPEDNFESEDSVSVVFMWPFLLAAILYFYLTDKGDDDE